MSQHCDWLLTNIRLSTMVDNGVPYGEIEFGALALHDGVIVYAGSEAGMPEFTAAQHRDCAGQWATPGLVDCHTHLVYGGDRAREFEMRLQGRSYEEISRAGGGIASTVKHTREASEDQLLEQARKRLQCLLAEGVTTVEIKSGYGLTLEHEMKMLRVARRLGEELPVTVRTTFLGAHALPPEFTEATGDPRDAYIQLVCEQMIPAVASAGLADAVDVFCEGIGFSPAQCEKVFRAAQSVGLPVKGHMEQLSDLKGAVLAARYSALSVDHLEYLAESDVAALKAAASVAVLLPGAFYFLRETKLPPIAALRKQGVPMAVATDLNPGTSPIASLLLAMNQAAVLFGLTPEEALRGATRNAALALGLHNKGQLCAGFDADLALWDIEHPSELTYAVNMNRPSQVWRSGVIL
ncbi:MAG: imidazolonepropionase [Proteobacteria bacterium]|nr:imidazolonepropionase [Pseudomonadota bacterium]